MTILINTAIALSSEWLGSVSIDHTALTRQAHQIAVLAHFGVRRTAGDTYVNHSLRVAQRLQAAGFAQEVVAAAILHDVVEDSQWTLTDLAEAGMPDSVVMAVDSVTKREGEPYELLVSRAAADRIGRLVKLSDNADNSSADQLAPLPAAKRARVIAKYAAARVVLASSLGLHVAA